MPRFHKLTNVISTVIIICLLLLISACDKSSSNKSEDAVKKNPTLYLNDTGLTQYTQTLPYRTINDPMPAALTSIPDITAPKQDADYGKDRDIDVNDNDGRNGFKFVRLDSNGTAFTIPPTDYAAEAWSCVKDENTGLIWEVKTISGLQANFNTYSWYNSDSETNGGNAGSPNTGESCYQTLGNCNTESFINAINSMNNGKGLCGLNNWRLPLREELRSILDYSISDGPMIDTAFFPNTMAGDTWSAQTAFYSTITGDQAWEVHFNSGYSEAHDKSSDKVYVRLVHDPIN